MELKLQSIDEQSFWKEKVYRIPSYDVAAVRERTKSKPRWLHFGAGNIFRGFIAGLQEELLEKGLTDTGIIAADTFDTDIIQKIYRPYDNLTVLVMLGTDGVPQKRVIASVAEAIETDGSKKRQMDRLKEIFADPGLEMISFTITEKGYAGSAMTLVTEMLYERYQKNAAPIAMVSMDNCSRNGEKLREAVLSIAEKMVLDRQAEPAFLCYVSDEKQVAFPWSMIDKITPRPAEAVAEMLRKDGLTGMNPIITNGNTYIAPYVNAEIPQYLVVEDRFPNGRPPLEEAGVYFADKKTVSAAERMKVTTCLNPLHTALAVFGCLLGYDSIAAEMRALELSTLVRRMGYEEGMPVVTDPGVISPKVFLEEVLNERLPNPYIPDTPQRIACDTSQKVAIRFGETLKAYQKTGIKTPGELTYIPLVLAGWLRYLVGLDDNLQKMELSSDPMRKELTEIFEMFQCSGEKNVHEILEPVLSDEKLFGLNLYEAGLGEKIEGMFVELLNGKGAVKRTLQKYCI